MGTESSFQSPTSLTSTLTTPIFKTSFITSSTTFPTYPSSTMIEPILSTLFTITFVADDYSVIYTSSPETDSTHTSTTTTLKPEFQSAKSTLLTASTIIYPFT